MNLTYYRKQGGFLTLKQAAERLELVTGKKIKIQNISRWEHGGRTPRPDMILALAEAYCCEIEDIIKAVCEERRYHVDSGRNKDPKCVRDKNGLGGSQEAKFKECELRHKQNGLSISDLLRLKSERDCQPGDPRPRRGRPKTVHPHPEVDLKEQEAEKGSSVVGSRDADGSGDVVQVPDTV